MDQIHYSGYFTTSSLCCFFQPLRLRFVHFHSFIILSPPLLSPIILFICFSSFSQLAVESRFSVQIESIGLFYAHNTHTHTAVSHTLAKRIEMNVKLIYYSLFHSADPQFCCGLNARGQYPCELWDNNVHFTYTIQQKPQKLRYVSVYVSGLITHSHRRSYFSNNAKSSRITKRIFKLTTMIFNRIVISSWS